MGDPDEFLTYLATLKQKLENHHNAGEPFLLSELPETYPAEFSQKAAKNNLLEYKLPQPACNAICKQNLKHSNLPLA